MNTWIRWLIKRVQSKKCYFVYGNIGLCDEEKQEEARESYMANDGT